MNAIAGTLTYICHQKTIMTPYGTWEIDPKALEAVMTGEAGHQDLADYLLVQANRIEEAWMRGVEFVPLAFEDWMTLRLCEVL